MVIDPTYTDAVSYNIDGGTVSYDINGLYFDIDHTIAAYMYFPVSNDDKLKFRSIYNTKMPVQTIFIDIKKFNCNILENCILTKPYTFEWFISVPYITHQYYLYENVCEKVFVTDTIKKFLIFKKITKKYTIVNKSIKYKLIDLSPYKTIVKNNYCEYGTYHIKKQITHK